MSGANGDLSGRVVAISSAPTDRGSDPPLPPDAPWKAVLVVRLIGLIKWLGAALFVRLVVLGVGVLAAKYVYDDYSHLTKERAEAGAKRSEAQTALLRDLLEEVKAMHRDATTQHQAIDEALRALRGRR